MYSIDNADVDLVQTVSMTEEDGTVYVVSLFVEAAQKDAILQPVLENFAIVSGAQVAEGDTSEVGVGETGVGEKEIAASTDLIEPIWMLAQYDDGAGQLVEVLPAVEVTAEFGADGRVSGSASCNDYVSLYTLDGENLDISLPAMTRMICATSDGIMLQETSYLGNLTRAATYQLEGNVLQIFNEDGGVILVYQAP